MDPISMICPPGSACPFTAGLGLPEVLLWVLSFAVIFAILTKAKIFSRAPAALISIAVAFLVLMAAPAALITVIASMSTGLIALGIGALVLIALLEISGAKSYVFNDKGQVAGSDRWLSAHGTITAAVVLVLAAIIFWTSGGAALIGIPALPMLSAGTILIGLVGIAVLWMLSESDK